MSNINYDFPITRISCPVENVTGVWEFIRPPFFKYLCYSLPGHLLHLVTKGSYTIKINSREYNVKAGDVIYYYEAEEVETIGDETEVIFYSVGFQAQKLLPLPIDRRVFSVNPNTQKMFYELYEGFSLTNEMNRSFRVYSSLLNILNSIEGLYSDTHSGIDEKEELWWALERRIRRNKTFRISLVELGRIAGYSKSTIIRSCRKVTGGTPMQRIQRIRMEEARGLLSFAHLNVSQVAEYLGYPRINEFSREFSKYYNKPPSVLIVK
ncbi:MAG: helix-turn-helix domain-containing protein [Marinilabiliaceae bacterium]|nr:helix-turn-helix domain-containing protein [Marinilabiliaceae bacterium]